MSAANSMVGVLKRAAGKMTAGEGEAAEGEKPEGDDEKHAKRDELKTAVMEFKSAEDPDAALDAFLAAMELCKGYEAD